MHETFEETREDMMPQLDFLTYPSQIFWLLVTFLLLYVILARSALPQIRETLQVRQERITSDLEKAKGIKNEAEAAQKDYTLALSNARSESGRIAHEAHELMKQEAQDRHHQLDVTLSKQIEEAEQLLSKSRVEAIESLQPVASEVAQLIHQRITGREANQSDIDKIVGRLLHGAEVSRLVKES